MRMPVVKDRKLTVPPFWPPPPLVEPFAWVVLLFTSRSSNASTVMTPPFAPLAVSLA